MITSLMTISVRQYNAKQFHPFISYPKIHSKLQHTLLFIQELLPLCSLALKKGSIELTMTLGNYYSISKLPVFCILRGPAPILTIFDKVLPFFQTQIVQLNLEIWSGCRV